MWRKAVVVLLAALSGLWLGAPPAAAHFNLVSSTPANGATVDRSPSVVILTFDAPPLALGTRLAVTGPTGEVDRGSPEIVGKTVRQPLHPDAPAGRYRVDWRATSDDGHPISGQLSFTVKAAARSQPSSAGSAPRSAASTGPSASSAPPASAAGSPPESAGGGSALPWVAVGVVVLAGIGYPLLRRRSGS